MVIDMQQGANVYSMTQRKRRCETAGVGYTGLAGIVGGTGGNYAQQFIDAFTFSYTGEAARSFTNALELTAGTASTIEPVSPLAEGLPLIVGDITVNEGASLTLQPAAGTDPDWCVPCTSAT